MQGAPQPNFDPFIHGTTSQLLALWARTEFKLLSPLVMASEYYAAPASGELTGGGFRNIGVDDIHSGKTGQPAFGRLTTSIETVGTSQYSLEEIVGTYGRQRRYYDDEYVFCEIKSSAVEKLFANINLLIIFVTRLRQAGKPMQELYDNEELEKLWRDIENTRQFYYFLGLIGKIIHPDYRKIHPDIDETFPKWDDAEILKSIKAISKWADTHEYTDITKAIQDELGLSKVLKRMEEVKVDIKAIEKSSDEASISSLLRLLEVRNGESVRQYFTTVKPPDRRTVDKVSPKNAFYRMIRNAGELDFAYLMGKFVAVQLDTTFWETFHECLRTHIRVFEERVALLRKVIEAPQSAFHLSDDSKYFLNRKPFPIILICESGAIKPMHGDQSTEFRATRPLKLGEDIKLIATDTLRHRLEVMKWLDKQGITGVRVVSIQSLYRARHTHKAPKDRFHSNNGIVRKAWQEVLDANPSDAGFFASISDKKLKRAALTYHGISSKPR